MPLYLLAAWAHETLGDALLPRGLHEEAEEAFQRGMEWRREMAAAALLVGGGDGDKATVDAALPIPPGAAGSPGVTVDGETANTLLARALLAVRGGGGGVGGAVTLAQVRVNTMEI